MSAQPTEAVRVAADPFRAHLGMLLDRTGLPWPVLALKAGVQPVLVRHLLFGDRGRRLAALPLPVAQRLYGLDETALRRAGRNWVPAWQARSDLSRLIADGFGADNLARYCRLTATELRGVLGSARCLELTELLARSARLQYARIRSAAPGR